MAKTCAKCCESITGIDFVVCRGYCGATFHMNACSGGVTRAMLSYFTTHKKNLFWMCDNCAELFENTHFRAISSRADEQSPLVTLTAAITELRTEIKQLNSKPVAQFSPAANIRWPVVEQRRAIKRPREFDAAARAPEDCRVGSKKALENVIAVPICDNVVDQRFWLYLSKIRPDVTVESVSSMAKANLETDSDITVVKLVPKGKSVDTLSFVSFKIGLDPLLKGKALDPATWPEGLLFREFEDYGTQKFRVPLKSRKPATPLLPPQFASSPITPIMDLS